MDMSWLGELRAFVEACKKDPALLVDPSLAFLRDYLTSLGADLPAAAAAKSGPKVPTHPTPLISVPINEEDGTDMRDPTVETDELDADIVESDLELEGDVVQPDHSDAPQKMGDPSFEVTEESRDASQKEKGMATEAISEGKLQEAVEHLTKAILLNPTSAMMYATRASVFIKMKKPAAATGENYINPDSAKGYKTRGMANSMLGKWEEAARDLHAASNIDYNDEIKATLKKVEPNAHKIVEHRRKYDRLWKERNDKKSERDRLRRRAEAQAAYEKAKRSEQSPSGGMPCGFPGGGMPGGMHGDFLGTAKRLLCSTASAEYISEVLDDDNISSSQVPATPLDSDDLLEVIILHLPRQPSSLPRASLVCKRWHSLLSDQKFTACYRKHHRKAPLLGFFAGFDVTRLNFVPFPDTEPNSIPIPTERFAVPKSSRPSYFWSFLPSWAAAMGSLSCSMRACAR
ncbi:FAM10 family protein At4g22670-like [Triticum dicoccoides]|uniref:FAM10 family protein At4g22670-like n=1 Tax=Triticum dicoccoides TaxID=85692 RepID=UPI00189159BE|nr:FAM10 family protein At4g22670-like [Triticum dicoccoides]